MPDYREGRTLPLGQSLQCEIGTGKKLFAANQLDAAEAEFVKVLYMGQDHPISIP